MIHKVKKKIRPRKNSESLKLRRSIPVATTTVALTMSISTTEIHIVNAAIVVATDINCLNERIAIIGLGHHIFLSLEWAKSI